jgi:hypothetical protein
MNDTDKLIAAIFAASMIARESDPKPGQFFGFYDMCVDEILRREGVERAIQAEKTLLAQEKAWG